jgi:tight adherence protein B
VTRRLTLVAAAALALAGQASADVRVAGVDTSGYPEVRVTVVAPLGSARPSVTENGAPVVGAQSANLGRAKSIVLAVDRSNSMQGRPLADAAAAARAFVAAKVAGDRVEVIAFGHQALALTRFSSSTADAGAALRQLSVDPASGTALWDAVVLAGYRLAQEEQPGHAIIVVTDGHDVSSTASFADAVAAAHRARAAVYAIAIAGSDFRPGPLRELATQTGGSYLRASSSSQLAALYASIGRTLARTWQVRYPTAARPGDRLRVTVSVPGAGSAAKTVAVDGTSGVPAAAASQLLPRSAWSSGLAPVLVALAVGLLFLLACLAAAASRSGLWLSDRLAHHLGPAQPRSRTRRRREGRVALRALLAATEQTFANVKQFRALQLLLARADLPLLGSEIVCVCLGAGILLGLFAVLAGMPMLFAFLLMVVGAAVPVVFVSFRSRARIKRFDGQLPDLLITIAASLKAGHSFRHAIQAVVEEGAEPGAKEFKRVLTETRLGRPMDEALDEMAERIGSKDLSFVLTAVAVQRQIGGSLAGLFDIVAEIVRQRQQFTRKIRSLTAMGRMSAYVLAGLPFLVALGITVLNPSYMTPLWGTATGHQLVAMGLTMLAVGALILKKIVSFKG